MFSALYDTFLNSHIAVLFLIIAIGFLIGNIKIKGFTLGPSGVLFVALFFGHFGHTVPSEIKNLGIILFVYMVGLHAGPRFFRTFKKRGMTYALLALVIVGSAMLATVAVALTFHLSPDLAAGIFAGAITSTPGLAAAIEGSGSTLPSVGYGISYPLGVLGVLLFVQFMPRILKTNLDELDDRLKQSNRDDQDEFVDAALKICNPNVADKMIRDLDIHSLSLANITRVQHEGIIGPAKADTKLQIGDIISVTGQRKELSKLKLLLGDEIADRKIFTSGEVVFQQVFISEKAFSGKSIGELNIHSKFGVVVTRVQREGFDFSSSKDFVLETGDRVRIVGAKEDCEVFEKAAGYHVKRIQETNILTFATGIILGTLLGFTPFTLPGGFQLRLGLAGGPLLVALLFSHFGRIGTFNIRVPYGAKYILRELGLVFFLAGAGTSAGQNIWAIVQSHGIILLFGGFIITVLPLIIGYFVSAKVFHINLLSSLGAVCGGMTSTPALGAVTNTTDSEQPAIAYTAIYPAALILTTVAAQILIMILK